MRPAGKLALFGFLALVLMTYVVLRTDPAGDMKDPAVVAWIVVAFLTLLLVLGWIIDKLEASNRNKKRADQ